MRTVILGRTGGRSDSLCPWAVVSPCFFLYFLGGCPVTQTTPFFSPPIFGPKKHLHYIEPPPAFFLRWRNFFQNRLFGKKSLYLSCVLSFSLVKLVKLQGKYQIGLLVRFPLRFRRSFCTLLSVWRHLLSGFFAGRPSPSASCFPCAVFRRDPSTESTLISLP